MAETTSGTQQVHDEAPKRLRHGDRGDPRYPSPRRLRWALSFAVDWLLHTPPLAVWPLTWGGSWQIVKIGGEPGELIAALPPWWVLLLTWLGLSFADRVVLQWACQATIGKLIFGLRIVHPETGGRISFWTLVGYWFRGAGATLIVVLVVPAIFAGGDLPSFDPHFHPKPVRRKDIGKYSTDGAPAAIVRPPALDRVRVVTTRRRDPGQPEDRPPRFRTLLSWTIDIAVHIVPAMLALAVLVDLPSRMPQLQPTADKLPPWWALLALWPALSFVHRVVVQWALGATLGKLVTGLRVVDAETEGRVDFVDLLIIWAQSWLPLIALFWLLQLGPLLLN
ncbi:RDD family protein [Nocardia sp. BMG51109]|uniref:RDD family protein n=1 Tax=Nocardia sp. BMG51109 TaxID=1056816 RepID=UPI0012EC1D2F|nr:RDD family protein [Nocardia sp. BMG51109]